MYCTYSEEIHVRNSGDYQPGGFRNKTFGSIISI